MGVLAANSNDVYVGFNIIRGHGGSDDGVVFNGSTGVDRRQRDLRTTMTACMSMAMGGFNGLVDVLGNIIRDNDADGVDFRRRQTSPAKTAMAACFSVVGGNTIEGNGDDGVSQSD